MRNQKRARKQSDKPAEKEVRKRVELRTSKPDNVVDVDNFDYSIIRNAEKETRPRGNNGGKDREYIKLVTAFDIETTNIDEIDQAVMYVWQYQIDDICTVIGRRWVDFERFIHNLAEALPEDLYMVTYIHNASFEFQFLAGIYNFMPEEVFSIRSQKVLKFTMLNRIEFRCSYLHSNMSLSEYLKKMNVKNKKISGDLFDYSKKRYWFTKLNNLELSYIVNDVRGLVQAIKKEMEIDGDTLYTIPATSTGYVRRDCKRAMNKRRPYIHKIFPSEEVYTLLKAAFRGGNTHANRFYSGAIVDSKIYGPIHSMDRSSSYPDVICNHKFPAGKFYRLKNTDIDNVLNKIEAGYAVLMKLALDGDVRILDDHPIPYISSSKCIELNDAEEDNGRVLTCSHLVTVCTDIDFKIIMGQYDAESVTILEAFYTRYDYLPLELTEVVRKYYKDKTTLKVTDADEKAAKTPEEIQELEDRKIFYAKSKNLLNAVFGMMCESLDREEYLFIPDPSRDDGLRDTTPAWKDKEGNIHLGEKPLELSLEDAKRRAFLSYAWGVWVTSWARYELQLAIDEVIAQGATVLYVDTDSVKYFGSVDMSGYNKAQEEKSRENGALADDRDGVSHYMGVYEIEHDMSRFLTWGAKKYAYEEADGSLHITIAGVNKKKGAEELRERGGLEALVPGFIFRKAGGLQSVYNKEFYGAYKKGKKAFWVTRNIMLKESTYKLGITKEYDGLIKWSRRGEKAVDVKPWKE